MIESNIIEWLDFGESIQKIDSYSKTSMLYIFRFYRELLKNKFPVLLDIILIIVSFFQLLCLTSYFAYKEGDFILEVLNYLNIFFIISNEINNINYIKFYIIINLTIIIDIFFMLIILFTSKKMKLNILAKIINLINIIIFYYLLFPAMEIYSISFLCQNGKNVYMQLNCFSTKIRIINIIFSILVCLLYIFIAVAYSIFFKEIGLISKNKNEKITRINSNYELLFILGKIIIFILYFFTNFLNENNIIIYVYIGAIFAICLFTSIYVIKYVYYYNNKINVLINIGWFFCSWFSFCIFVKMVSNINNVSNSIIIGWIIIILLLTKTKKIKEISLITESDILEFNDIKSIEMHNNILLNELSNKNYFSTKIILYGTIKKFETYLDNSPEINYHYHKLLNDKYLNNKFNKEIDLPILSIIYILYAIQLEKSSFKEYIALYMSYFLINYFNNPVYAIFLSSRIKSSGLGLYYKYLLFEDIKDFSTLKFQNPNKESIKHVQIGTIILYYLYMDLLKVKIYDGITNQIDYFDILKNNITFSNTSSNFMKTGKNILKIRKEILTIWEKITELNPFSDESYKDYMLYLDTILQDDILVREESKKYSLNEDKTEEKFNTYHSMFLMDTSSLLLIDGYISIGKILYASPNFSLIFSYNSKELLHLTIDDLLPNIIQSFHKELIEDAIKYSNINYRFKKQINALLKNKNEGLYNIKLFVKAVPNIKFGLIFFSYLQKITNSNFLIILDKDLKINGFTEMNNSDLPFTYEIGYNLSHTLYGYHIGLIIPDILPLLEYKNEEFDIIKKDIELKGYLYQVKKKEEIKIKVDNILENIKKNNNNNNNNTSMKYEDSLQNINEGFNELISELNSQKIKPYSIFYKVQMHSFLDGKYKYYKISISDDILSENGRVVIIDKGIEESKIYKSSISNGSNQNILKIKKDFKKKTIKIDEHILKNNNDNKNKEFNEENYKKMNDDMEVNKGSAYTEEKDKLNKKNNKNNNPSSINSQLYKSDSNFNIIKLSVINKKEGITIKIMKMLCLLFLIDNILFIFLDNKVINNYFIGICIFFESNQIFIMAKLYIGVMYILAQNIKWEIHNCMIPLRGFNFTSLYEIFINKNINYLLEVKNTTNNIGLEFKDIVSKKHEIFLNIYGSEIKQKTEINLDNYLLYIINDAINIIDSHATLLEKAKKSNKNLDSLTFGYNDLLDLGNLSYSYYMSDIDGFTEEEKKSKIKNVSNIFPLISNSFILVVLLIFYIISLIKLHRTEIYFLEKLINFNSTNFEGYLKNLEEIKKKLQNDNLNEEEEKDDMDINDLDSKKNSKEENEKESKMISHKKLKTKKKDQNKIGKMIKQKNNKYKIMSSFFIKINIFLGVKILLIMITSLSYYILSELIEISKKNEFYNFDTISNDIIGVFKESYDVFIKFKKELENFENNLEKCKVRNKILYKLDLPDVETIKNPRFGNNIIQISSDFGFKGKNLENFVLLFSENACSVLAHTNLEKLACSAFSDFLFHGMVQCVSKISSMFGRIIEELNSINDDGSKFKVIFNKSNFHNFEIFIEYYYEKTVFYTEEIFKDLRHEKLDQILYIFKNVIIIYVIATLASFFILFYLIYSLHNTINTFLYFIGILPFKYLSEDEKFYKEVIKFGNQYFGSN